MEHSQSTISNKLLKNSLIFLKKYLYFHKNQFQNKNHYKAFKIAHWQLLKEHMTKYKKYIKIAQSGIKFKMEQLL